MKLDSIDFFVGIGVSLTAGLAINVVTDAKIDHGIATFLVLAVIDVILLFIYKEPFVINIKKWHFSLVGISMGGAIFLALYFIQKTNITISAPNGFLDYATYLINVAIIVPIFEEITVRRLMFVGASYYIGPALSALAVSALFAATHTGLVLFSFAFSVIMCSMTWKGVDTYSRAILHGSYNGTISILWIISGIEAARQ